MSDNIYQNSMAYVGDTPWHGKGNRLNPDMPIEVWEVDAGFNWKVKRAFVRFYTNGGQDDLKTFDNQIVLFRSDTEQPLAVVSKQFKPVQPKTILEFYRDLTAQHGFALETAGVLDEGRKLWALAKVGKSFELPGHDHVSAYLLLATANDGTYSTTARFTAIRTVCQNTLEIALRGDTEAEVKVNHRSIFDPASVKMDLGIYSDQWNNFEDNANKMARHSLSEEELVKYFIQVFHNPNNKDDKGQPDYSDVSKRKLHRLIDLTLSGKGADMESSQGTMWGAYNAIAEDYDWKAGRNQDSGLRSAWFGQGARMKQEAYGKAVQTLEIDPDHHGWMQRPSPNDGGLLDSVISETLGQ